MSGFPHSDSMAGPSRAKYSYDSSRGTSAAAAGGQDKALDAEEEYYDDPEIDPDLRLRTTMTAHSVIAESIRIETAKERRKRKRKEIFASLRRKTLVGSTRRGSLAAISETTRSRAGTVTASEFGRPDSTHAVQDPVPPASVPAPPAVEPRVPLSKRVSDLLNGKARQKAPERRTIYVNTPLPAQLLHKGNPIVRYVRNKVRTSKYTLITFLPKNLFEQFRRVANIYFLGLVILQLFPVFGAPNAQIGMLPLLAILGMTAIKDAIEDWRRATQDNQVNNSATTKLGGWRNVNQPRDPRSFIERMLGIGNAPGQTSKGVRKLRQAEATAGRQIVKDTLEAQNDSPPSISEASFGKTRAPSTMSMASRRSAGVMDWSVPGAGTAGWERTLWKKLEVGDFVLLQENDQIPADIICLSTSNVDHLCFVETKNLDGETNLKVRRALKATCDIGTEEDLEHARFSIDSEAPHANLYSYNGVLRYADDKREVRQEAITINEMLLRGCSLRNTKWVIGIVAYTGADTKIMLNGGDTPSKRSKIERETNFNVIMNFVLLMVLCLLTAILYGWYQSLPSTSAEWYEPGAQISDNVVLSSVVIFFSCLIVFQNIVPISLYITIEVVKTIQAYFIFQDIEMYYDVYDTPCVPKSWGISDDLGQIEYVFSDKTGTLTQNIMEFKKCSVQGIAFGEGVTEAMMGAAKREGRELTSDPDQMEDAKQRMIDIMRPIRNRYQRDDKLTLIAPNLATRLVSDDPLRPHLIDFFRAIAVCHTVLSDSIEPFVLDYQAESPDEAALVAAARDVGFPFVNRNNERIDIEVLGEPERWTPLRVLEFNSTRKRMSVVARSPDGRVVLFCKGADSVIYERLASDHDEHVKQATLKNLEDFANGGLRTLCIASRELGESEYQEWAKTFDAASAAVHDREGEIERACELVEHSLTILGATALEDKLQEGVPEAIATLHQAGIKLWILTGDKLQTAIEIGYSCNLLTNDMEVMIISTDSESGARAQIEAGLNKIASKVGLPGRQPPASVPTFAVVIDGESLRYALGPELKGLFLSLGMQCAAVICCRVSPSQKALTVRLVKEGCNAMTLAIGDGANDVAMIQEANIGVGLFGLEGSQAAMSADYAFGQFRFLTRLLLVHGRWSYVRVADMHANFFYKNVIWTLAMFWYFIFTSFDATYLFEYITLLFYNLFFTSLPVAVLGMFDQDTNAQASMAFPQLYKPGIRGSEYTRTRFWLYMGDGVYQSAILFFIPFLAYGAGETWSSHGIDNNSLSEFGSVIACAGVLAANAYVGINTRYWTVIAWVIIIGSTLLVYIWIPIYSVLAPLPFVGTAHTIFPTFTFWAVVILTVFLCVGPRWFVKAFKASYMPSDKDIVREAWIAGDLKDQLGIAHRSKRRRKGRAMDDAEQFGSPDAQAPRGAAERFVDDHLGSYAPADLSSPHRPRSPASAAASDDTPRYTYPPSPLVHGLSSGSSTPARVPPMPSPMPAREETHSPFRPHNPRSRSDELGYTSPTYEAFKLAQPEIGRLSEASAQLKRMSMVDDGPGSAGMGAGAGGSRGYTFSRGHGHGYGSDGSARGHGDRDASSFGNGNGASPPLSAASAASPGAGAGAGGVSPVESDSASAGGRPRPRRVSSRKGSISQSQSQLASVPSPRKAGSMAQQQQQGSGRGWDERAGEDGQEGFEMVDVERGSGSGRGRGRGGQGEGEGEGEGGGKRDSSIGMAM